jgi:hypothetical protein
MTSFRSSAPPRRAVPSHHQAELARLGPNGAQTVRAVNAWLKGLEARRVLTAQEHGTLRRVHTAEGVMALAKLRDAMRQGAPPLPTDSKATEMLRKAITGRDPKLGEQAVAMLQKSIRTIG